MKGRQCPPGVICIENYALFFGVVCVCIVVYLFFLSKKDNVGESNQVAQAQIVVPSWPYTNNDPLLNPYAPPLRDERYVRGIVPINVSTNVGAVDAPYRQVGLLTATNVKGEPMPLMGRPLFTNRDKWQYYTNSNQFNSVRLPISRNGRSCTNEYGCDKLFTGDTVYVEGINQTYRVTLYDNDTIRYLPFI